MKKLFLSFSVLASLLVAGCSSDDAVSDNETDGQITTHYMCVNIVSADGGSATRDAVQEQYEDGNPDENKVSGVRFYFFTENGAAANVKLSGSTYVNYVDWTPTSEDNKGSDSQNDNVESIMSATIVINTKAGDKLPRSIIAVLNPTSTLKDQGIQGLTQFRAFSNDYAQPDLTVAGKFVMTNSVYGKGTSPVEEVCAVYIENQNICDTEDKAKEKPVTIYVERNVAKVIVSLDEGLYSGTTDNNNKYDKNAQKLKLKDKDGKDITVTQTDNTTKEVYLQLDGWALTAETDKGNLVKRINTTWDSKWWNEGAYRSTWALNAADAENKWTPKYSDTFNAFGAADYTNENAEPFSNGTTTNTLAKTKFLIKGKLCYSDGTTGGLTLAKHYDKVFVDTYTTDGGDNNFPNLRESILSYLKAMNVYFYYKESDTSFKAIEATDIAIKPNDDNLQEKENSDYNCYVRAVLTESAKTKTWYQDIRDRTVSTSEPTSESDLKEITAQEINNHLSDKAYEDEAMVWKEGQTYYYSEILHRNFNSATPAAYGVVRNHVYKVNVANIVGLGTPVYNPDKIIYPEHPNEDDSYIAAKISILAWRVVTQDYQLKW